MVVPSPSSPKWWVISIRLLLDTISNLDYVLTQVTSSWKQYVKDITSRFGAPYDDPMAELMELKQTGSVTEVHDQFDCILSRLQLPPKYAMSCFLSILNEEI
ncbi:retrotransposable element Tf2, partial [Tanacetum coccineum]